MIEKGKRSCMKCIYYRMSAGEEERGRTSFDRCEKKGELPTAAFSFCDTCCGGSSSSCFSTYAFRCLEEIAENCECYEEKKKR